MNNTKKNHSIEEKKAARFKLLEAIYNATNGTEAELVQLSDIREDIKFTETLVGTTCEYLKNEGLIKAIPSNAGLVSITHYGIVKYEEAVSDPEKNTDYFPAVNIINNILNVDSSSNSQFQVGTVNSTQEQKINDDNLILIKEWIEKLEVAIQTESTDKNDEFSEEIETIKALLSTQKPNVSFINSSMHVIKNLLFGVSSNAIFHGLLQSIPI